MDKNNLQKKKVLHAVYSFKMGGAEKVVFYYTRYHDRNRFEPVVCSLTDDGELGEEVRKLNVKTFVFNKQQISPISFLLRLVRFIRSEKIDIIHSHNLVVNNWLAIAAFFSSVKEVIRTDHTEQNQFYNKGVLFSVISRLLGVFNKKVISVSSRAMVSNREKDFFNKDKYITVHNGIDPDLYLQKTNRNEIFCKEFLVEAGNKIVGNIGNLTPQKGQKYLIESAKIILDQYKDVTFIIVGMGALKDELVVFAEKLGIRRKIVFAGFRTDIPELLQMMDIFVLSSLREGFAISLLEAMAAKKACVVTDVGGNCEAVEDGITGYVVPPKDSNQLADRILKLLKDDALRDSFGEKGRNKVLENFTADRMVRETERLYNL